MALGYLFLTLMWENLRENVETSGEKAYVPRIIC